MATETPIQHLTINKLTKAQYDSAVKSDTELYFITDTGLDALLDQASNTGKFLSTDGTQIIWKDALANNSTASRGIAVGTNATATIGGVSYGVDSNAGNYAVAIGDLAKATGKRSAQIGKGTNGTAQTLMYGNDYGNFTLLNSDGTVPAERMSSTGGTIGQILSKTETGMAWETGKLSNMEDDTDLTSVTIREWE